MKQQFSTRAVSPLSAQKEQTAEHAQNQPRHHQRVGGALSLVVAALVSACSNLTIPGSNPNPDTSVTTPEAITPATSESTQTPISATEASTAAFDSDTLFGLLLGEIAAQRRLIPTAVEQYSQAAQNTQDSGIAEHATRLSLYGANNAAALDNVKIWYDTAQDADSRMEAATIYAELLSKAQRPLDAMAVMEEQLQHGGDTQFALIAAGKDARDEALQATISSRLQHLYQTHPNNTDLAFALAIDAERQERHEAALQYTKQLLQLDPSHERGIIYEASILEAMGRDKDATKQLRKAVRRLPDNRRIKLQYARLLTKTNLPKSQTVFAELLSDNPYDADLVLSHAMVAKENKDYLTAIGQFTKLVNLRKHSNIAHYQLGVIAEERGDYAEAEANYRKINTGGDAVSAAQKLITLMGKQQRQEEAQQYMATLRQQLPDYRSNLYLVEARWLTDSDATAKALKLLSAALKNDLNNTALRFERAIVAEKLGKHALMESDFRYILLEKPDDIATLNALGYALTNHSTRYKEAQQLIEKALAQEPEDAAIIDSMGWVQFKQGELDKAEANLRRAFDKLQDDEIAAHLVELYWVTQRPKQARSVIKTMRAISEPTPFVDAVIERFGIR